MRTDRLLEPLAGAQHRAQRRILNPAFGSTQIHKLSSIFTTKANEV